MEEGDDKTELEDSPAIKALGSLFLRTEVQFWVNLYTGMPMPYDSTTVECTKTVMGNVVSSRWTERSISSPVETELTQQMNELGLPLSFSTNKEKRIGKGRGKRSKKVLHTHEETTDEVCDVIKANEFVDDELQAFCGESLKCDTGCGSINNTVLTSDEMQINNAHVNEDCKNPMDGSLEERPSDPLVANQSSEFEQLCSNVNIECPQECDMVLDSIIPNNNDTVHAEFGDWTTYWDEFYERNYYYNSRTHESTWELPSGLEHLGFVDVSNDTVFSSSQVDYNSDADKIDDQQQNVDVSPHDAAPIKRKKKVKKTRAHRRSSIDNKELEYEVSCPTISKYWCQRYVLFSKYDEGIRMDKEGWFSATPECIAKHHAFRCQGGVVVDCFTGVGGNAIRFAPKSSYIIAIDIDPKKIEYAQHNAAIYGVEDHIDFVTGDCFNLAQNLKADTVFLSPPWGGPEYAKTKSFDINTMLKPHDGQFLFNVAKEIAPKIVMFLPRNVDITQLAELSLSANPPWKLEVEKNFVNGKLKAITAYFTHPLVCK